MIKVTEKAGRTSEAVLNDLLSRVGDGAEAAAKEGMNALKRNLSPGPRSGKQHPGSPRVSSAPGEYSQFQKGNLFDMAGYERVSDEESIFGLFPQTREDIAEALAQELGAPRRNVAPRANVRNTGLDPRTHAAMQAALLRVLT